MSAYVKGIADHPRERNPLTTDYLILARQTPVSRTPVRPGNNRHNTPCACGRSVVYRTRIIRYNTPFGLFDVAQQGHAPERPVHGRVLLGHFQPQLAHVRQPGPLGLLVHRARVAAHQLRLHRVDGVHVDHGHFHEHDLVHGLPELAVFLVPAGAFQKQPVHVDAFLRFGRNKKISFIINPSSRLGRRSRLLRFDRRRIKFARLGRSVRENAEPYACMTIYPVFISERNHTI